MALRIPFDQGFWQEYLTGQEAMLPTVLDMKHVTERVIRILGGNPGPMRLQGTNTYLVGTGRCRILVDTGQGEPCWIKKVVRLLAERQLEISHVLLTHWHDDHVGGVPDLVAHDPELASRTYKHEPDPDQKPIADGQIFKVEGATVRAVFTPGHAADHMCFVLQEERALFTGDNVLGHGYAVVEDLGAYMGSLGRMASLGCLTGLPAHGERIADLPARLRDYIRHKEIRVRQVLVSLTRSRADLEARACEGPGGLTLRELARSIYGSVPDDVVDMALAPFLVQVLWKLAEDGKVGFEPGEPSKRRWFVSRGTYGGSRRARTTVDT
ncbi:hypothetical protein CDD83_3784 [Cordyceps sp. RAO-2017]|nr:hypothetical protein CDD83_3784 [Cordyceps sp. RAO-2017]